MLKEAEKTKFNFAEMSMGQIIDLVVAKGPEIAKNDFLRGLIVNTIERRMMKNLKNERMTSEFPAGVQDDRTAFGIALLHTAERALTDYDISKESLQVIFDTVMKDLFVQKDYIKKGEKFKEEFGLRPPTFLLISPGKGCNLHCTGCYADSGKNSEKLTYTTMNRIITEMYEGWGSRFVVVSGGEPTVWRSEGKGILDIAEAHPECFFLMYTNSTLIDDAAAKRMSRLGNITPAISVEGWRERTDARRGAGMYDTILNSMDRLHDHGVPFGISLTGTNQNYQEILSDEFIDTFIQEKKALYAWLFQYMPIGRSFTLDLMPNPEQRLWMWKRTWEIVREKKFFLADFWNSGTLTRGCLSAGGHNNGGYMYIDWNGNVSPCVFLPYSPANINQIYANGGTLNDVWSAPFFKEIRKWQGEYQKKNMMAPCPIRDHHEELRRMIALTNPQPADENARLALLDPEYTLGLKNYDEKFMTLTQPIWENYYCRDRKSADGKFADLPELHLSPKISSDR